jgi:hypothetical protein
MSDREARRAALVRGAVCKGRGPQENRRTGAQITIVVRPPPRVLCPRAPHLKRAGHRLFRQERGSPHRVSVAAALPPPRWGSRGPSAPHHDQKDDHGYGEQDGSRYPDAGQARLAISSLVLISPSPNHTVVGQRVAVNTRVPVAHAGERRVSVTGNLFMWQTANAVKEQR